MGRYDSDVRERAAQLMERGLGERAVASELAIPVETARKWVQTYRAVGREVFLGMGSAHRAYDYETKLGAVRDFVEKGLTKQQVMSKYGIVNSGQLKKWAKAYREGGPEALRPKRRGRPAGKAPRTHEQELEAENRRLRAEVAYLKKLNALEAAKRAPGRSAR